VRELRNALERALVLGTAPSSSPPTRSSTPTPARTPRSPLRSNASGATPSPARSPRSGGNRRRAAAHLGIGLRTLYEKPKHYDLH
jgi:DNA-binding NtrC family response regulator